jgi:hypothetical protein
METLLADLEIAAVVALSFMFALLIEPVLLMLVLGMTRRGLRRKHPGARIPVFAELRALATGPKESHRD